MLAVSEAVAGAGEVFASTDTCKASADTVEPNTISKSIEITDVLAFNYNLKPHSRLISPYG